MLTQEYLSLRLVRLASGDEWSGQGPGLNCVFPKGGAGQFSSGSGAQRLAPGDVLVMPSPSRSKLTVADRAELVFWHFCVSAEHLFPLFASHEICLVQSVLDGFKPAKLYPASSPLARECHRVLADVPPQFNLDHRSQLLRVAAVLLSAEFASARSERTGFVRADEHMMQVFEKLSSAELLGLSVAELADKFGCSRRHLNRLFHQHFGVSVATLRMEMRLSKAVSLLRDPDSKVIRVAEECGFNHLGLFNTCFKRRFGVSPGQWRKQTVPDGISSGDLTSSEADCPMRINGLCPWTVKIDNHGLGAAAASQPQQAAQPKKTKSSGTAKENRPPRPASDQNQFRENSFASQLTPASP